MPNEFVEAYFLLRVETYETITDSGGAELHRGGNGLSVAYRFPCGVNGGELGRRSTKRLIRANGEKQVLPAKCEGIEVKEGDRLYFDTWGGGGWGDPYDRPVEKVIDDVHSGLVSERGAERYGVVIKNGQADMAATEALREERKAARGKVTMFNRGGSIEEIKARCLEETGLPAPESATLRVQA